MNGQVGRLIHRINTEQAGDIQSGRWPMGLELIDLDPASTLEVLGVHHAAERKLAGSRRRGRSWRAWPRRSGHRGTRPIHVHGSFAGGIEAQILIPLFDNAIEHGAEADAVHPGANAHRSAWLLAGGAAPSPAGRQRRRHPVQVAEGGIDDSSLAWTANKIGER